MDEYVRVASSLPTSPSSPEGGQLHVLVGIALVLGLGKGGVPGLATIATAATVLTAPADIPGGLGYAVALMVPILTAIDVYAAWLHRSALDWPTVWILLPTSFVGMLVGQAADGRLSDGGARLLVGTILLGILALRTWRDVATRLFPAWAIGNRLSGDSREHKAEVQGKGSMDREEADALLDELALSSPSIVATDSDIEGGGGGKGEAIASPPPSKKKRRGKRPGPVARFLWACAVGLIGGAATMLTNSMGPILNVYLLSVAELSPRSYVGTRAAFFCFLNLGKLPLRVMGGTLGPSMMPLAMGLGCVAVLGVFLARPIMLGMREETFVRLELWVVAFAGLRLCYVGLGIGS